jgi:hypothetical protein
MFASERFDRARLFTRSARGIRRKASFSISAARTTPPFERHRVPYGYAGQEALRHDAERRES